MTKKLPGVKRTHRPGQEPVNSARRSESKAENRVEDEAASDDFVLSAATTLAVQPPADAANHLERKQHAQSIVDKHAAWSSALGMVPVPVVDVVGISGAQVRMIAALSTLYGVPFSDNWIRTILGVTLGSMTPWAITGSVLSFFVKPLRGIGIVTGIAGMAGFSNVATRTLGVLFIEHFEAGGNLADVDSKQMRLALEQPGRLA